MYSSSRKFRILKFCESDRTYYTVQMKNEGLFQSWTSFGRHCRGGFLPTKYLKLEEAKSRVEREKEIYNSTSFNSKFVSRCPEVVYQDS